MLLADSLKQSIHEIDAFLEGTLTIEEGQASLEVKNGALQLLDESYQIEVLTDYANHFITYQEAINTLSTDG